MCKDENWQLSWMRKVSVCLMGNLQSSHQCLDPKLRLGENELKVKKKEKKKKGGTAVASQ